jgi:hypothetical protein
MAIQCGKAVLDNAAELIYSVPGELLAVYDTAPLRGLLLLQEGSDYTKTGRRTFKLKRAPVEGPHALWATLDIGLAELRAHIRKGGASPRVSTRLDLAPSADPRTFDCHLAPDYRRVSVTSPDGTHLEDFVSDIEVSIAGDVRPRCMIMGYAGRISGRALLTIERASADLLAAAYGTSLAAAPAMALPVTIKPIRRDHWDATLGKCVPTTEGPFAGVELYSPVFALPHRPIPYSSLRLNLHAHQGEGDDHLVTAMVSVEMWRRDVYEGHPEFEYTGAAIAVRETYPLSLAKRLLGTIGLRLLSPRYGLE